MKSSGILADFHKLNQDFVIQSRQTGRVHVVLEIGEGNKVVFADDEGLRKTVTTCADTACNCDKEYCLSMFTMDTLKTIRQANSCHVDLKLINLVKEDILYWSDKIPSEHFKIGQWVTYRSSDHTPNGSPQTELILLTSTTYNEGGIDYLIGYTTCRGSVTPIKAAPWRVRIVEQAEIDQIMQVVNKLHPENIPASKGDLECN